MAVLSVEKGKQQGLRIGVLEDGEPMVMGRDPTADIVLEDERASRHHARIQRHRGEWIIEDLGSRNGVLYRGQTVRKTAIRDGEIFQIGSTVLKLLADEHLDPLPGGEELGARLQRLIRSEAGVLSYHGQQLAMDRPVRIDLTHPHRPLGGSSAATGSPNGPGLIAKIEKAVAAAGEIQHPAVLALLRSEMPNQHGGASVVLRWSEGRRLSDRWEEILATPLEARIAFYRRLAEAVLERRAPPLGYSMALSHVLVDIDAGPQVAALELSALLPLLRGQLLDLPDFHPYLAPEAQPAGTAPDWPILVYNLGAIGYHLLTGGPPMGEGGAEEILERHRTLAPAPPNVICPDLPRELSDLLLRMLQKDPAARPKTPEEVLGAIPQKLDNPPPAVDSRKETPAAPQASRPPPAAGRPSPVVSRPPPAAGRQPPAVNRRVGQPRAAPPPPQPAGLPLGVKLIVWPAIWAGLVVGLRYLTRFILEK